MPWISSALVSSGLKGAFPPHTHTHTLHHFAFQTHTHRGAPGRLLLPADSDDVAGGSVAGPAVAAVAAAPSRPEVWEFDPQALSAAGWGAACVLTRLAAALGPAAAAVRPGVNCRGVFATPSRPPLPPSCTAGGVNAGITSSASASVGGSSGSGSSGGSGSRLTAAELCGVVAALQPEGCVVVDESLTSGGSYWEASKVGGGARGDGCDDKQIGAMCVYVFVFVCVCVCVCVYV